MRRRSGSPRGATSASGMMSIIFSLLSLSSFSLATPGFSWSDLSVFDNRPDGCPPCFNCNLDDFVCQQFAECRKSSGRCNCPSGFGGVDCSEPLCGSLARGGDRSPRNGTRCECDEGWGGINCNVCLQDSACNAMMPEGVDGVCYTDGLVVRENYQICDITNKKILQQLKDRKPQATFSCNADSEKCNFQFWVDEVESFYCDLDTCSWDRKAEPSRNTTTYTCEHIQCACIPGRMLCGEAGSVDIGEFLEESIVGPAFFETISTEGGSPQDGSVFSEDAMNKLIQTFFGDASIFLKCQSGECLYKTDVPGYTRPIKTINTPLIAGTIAGCSLFVLATILFVWFLSRRDADIRGYGSVQLSDDEENETERLLGQQHVASLSFGRVNYSIDGRPILSGIHGSVKPGELLAIMGASGAGKTSFLDILARKNKKGVASGEFFVNSEHMSNDAFNRIIGFVDQDDTLLPTLTVHETILDSALLRLPKEMSLAAKEQKVEEVERQLGIFHIRHQMIGSEESGRGISGGEKRRVGIACELVTSPSILFLDEPTSGLDSYNAHKVIECLSSLAKTYGRTVIFTIHQPRSNIVTLFDRLILLAEGRMVYSGSMHSCRSHLERIGYPCPVGYNIADFLVDLTVSAASGTLLQYFSSVSRAVYENTPKPFGMRSHSADLLDPTAQWNDGRVRQRTSGGGRFDSETHGLPPSARSQLDVLVTDFSSSEAYKELDDELSHLLSGSSERSESSSLENDSKTIGHQKVGLLGQTVILSRRTWRNLYRNPMLMLTHYAIAIALAVFLGFLFYGLTDDIKGFQNRLGLFFFLLALFGFSTLTSLSIFSGERLLFARERAKGYYHPLSYFIAKVAFDIVPLRLLPPFIMGGIIYPMTGLIPAWTEFGVFILFVVLFNLAASSVCLFIGILFKNQGVANLMGILIMLFSLLFSGFLLNHETIPAPVQWLQKISIFHYAFEGLIVNEVVTLSLVDHKYGLDIEVPGAAILSSFGFDTQALWPDCRGLAVYAASFVVVAYVTLHLVLVEKR